MTSTTTNNGDTRSLNVAEVEAMLNTVDELRLATYAVLESAANEQVGNEDVAKAMARMRQGARAFAVAASGPHLSSDKTLDPRPKSLDEEWRTLALERAKVSTRKMIQQFDQAVPCVHNHKRLCLSTTRTLLKSPPSSPDTMTLSSSPGPDVLPLVQRTLRSIGMGMNWNLFRDAMLGLTLDCTWHNAFRAIMNISSTSARIKHICIRAPTTEDQVHNSAASSRFSTYRELEAQVNEHLITLEMYHQRTCTGNNETIVVDLILFLQAHCKVFEHRDGGKKTRWLKFGPEIRNGALQVIPKGF